MRFQAAKALTFLGFSEIEALVYCFLLQESPATGYRVSHAIGKPTANTYKAIAALAQRGAIVVDDSKNRLCRAVPYAELFDRMGRTFDLQRQQAEMELAKLRQAEGDDRVYQVTSVEQVLERTRAMLAGAKRVALLDVFPEALRLIADDLQAAARRGVKVVARVYAPVELKGAAVFVTPEAERVRAIWPGEQLSIAVDAEQFVTALLSSDVQSVHQAVWSNSTFLSCMQYNALQAELQLTAVQSGAPNKNLLEALSLTRLQPSGFERLNARYGDELAPKRRKK
ncbi:MAG: TrmB family transcriptional regulator [Alphaproteobacteria bacterium]|nr:TrmB family transcriptional regulator [Alphaproteobacteria bacterium]